MARDMLEFPEVEAAKKEDSAELKIMRFARDLISKPGRWTSHNMAVNHEGCEVNIDTQGAVRFCALGALGLAIMMVEGVTRPLAERRASEVGNAAMNRHRQDYYRFENIYEINDGGRRKGYGRKAILDIFDKEIARLEAIG